MPPYKKNIFLALRANFLKNIGIFELCMSSAAPIMRESIAVTKKKAPNPVKDSGCILRK